MNTQPETFLVEHKSMLHILALKKSLYIVHCISEYRVEWLLNVI